VADADLASLTATEAATEIARGALSAEEYSRAFLAQIAVVEDEFHAFTHLDPDHVLVQARALDERKASGQALGPLHGVPVAIKDIFDTADYPTECGSPILTGRRPFHDATVVARLRAAGAVILGKTVTTEFAYFHPGKTRNPHDPTRTPGGSSSGSAAAVAAGMVPLALGSQTNGSVIRPAAFCGVIGMKPSHGLVSRAGVLTLSRTLDHVGTFARSLDDTALLLEVIAGYDQRDPDTRPVSTAHFAGVLSEKWPLAPRFAFVRTPIWSQADDTTRQAFDELVARLGDACVAFDLPERFAGAWDAQRTIMAVEMAHNLGSVVDRGGDAASKVMRDLVSDGRKIGAVQYLKAVAEGRALAAAIADVFSECNAIITPASKGIAPKGLDATGDPAFCSLWTLMGLPALSLPLLTGGDGMPLGVQLVGAAGDDARVMRAARWLVDAVGEKRSRARGKTKRS
jgi:Asp-tRNA(Asn)/Glu-tRNA(Gln) amidotransferase A subunit family amidase